MNKHNKNSPQNEEPKVAALSNTAAEKEQLALDDERRVKVLSPAMLVIKRFLRNKLAIVGLCIIIFMFLFAFLGGAIMPYGEDQVFTGYEQTIKEYAHAMYNKDFRYFAAPEKVLPDAVKSGFNSAITSNSSVFKADGNLYYTEVLSEKSAKIFSLVEAGKALTMKGITTISSDTIPSAAKDAIKDSIKNGEPITIHDGVTYINNRDGKFTTIFTTDELAIATKNIYTPYTKDIVLNYSFINEFETALDTGATSFTADNVTYTVLNDNEFSLAKNGDTNYAFVSELTVKTKASNLFLGVDFYQTVQKAIVEKATEFTINVDGTDTKFYISGLNGDYTIKTATNTQLIKIYERPSATHLLGTDANGMDILTRLMYGGRVSLLIGFIVVLIEVVLGVILGGIAGYFGGFIDNLIMRIVDIFNCIPSLPLFIIIGSIMEATKVDPQVRMYYLMLILGFLSWPGIARLVRGQILSLREQEFMVAAEATGISVPRRIFKHLVPNVIPQLIVTATMGLGSIILTESTLSFLGIGVKFPFASWGNIINAVSSVYVMTNYWFVWIPAGLLILVTVLGFNFVGDGLRDAFDPKMKR